MPGPSRPRERPPDRAAARAAGRAPGGPGSPLPSPLPDDSRAVPPFPEDARRTVADGLAALSVTIPAPVLAAVEGHARLLLAWTGSINLTAHRTPRAVALEHIVDSLAALPLLAGTRSLLDLGSGGGYPGLPLAVALPVERAALVDSIGKKARFLAVAAADARRVLGDGDAGVPEITAVPARAEALASDRQHRGRWDVVTARAVAPLERLVSLAMPLLRPGGALVAWKRDDGSGALELELRHAAAAVRSAGGAGLSVHPVAVPELADHRLVRVVKGRAAVRAGTRTPTARRRNR